MYVDCTSFNIHTLIKASSPEKHTVQDKVKALLVRTLLVLANSSSCDQGCETPFGLCDLSSVMKSSLMRN